MHTLKLKGWAIFPLLALALSCGNPKKLPVMGPKTVLESDTLYHTIPDFELKNQYGQIVSVRDMKGKIFVTDFFFTTCPSICPIMKTQMLRVNEKFGSVQDFRIYSISIDPRHDTVEVLKEYSERLGIENESWQFLTGDLDSILDLAQKGFLVSAAEDSTAPGGYIHSGAFILVDKELRIRGYYDGTKELKVDELMKDIAILQKEYEGV